MDNDDNKSRQECNQLLLNAIKQKSANRKNGDINGAIFKPKQFVIPPLRVPTTAATTIQTKTTSIAAASSSTTAEPNKDAKVATHSEPSTSPLNQFLLNQLRLKNINGLSDGFKLPELKVPEGASNKKTFNIPLLNRLHESNNGLLLDTSDHIEKGVKNLSLNSEDGLKEHKQQMSPSSLNTNTPDNILIDLTAALIINTNDKESINRPAATERKRAQDYVKAKNALNFKIPLIECDRKAKRKRSTNDSIEAPCTMNVAHVKYNHNSSKPTALGEALSATDNCSNKRYFACAATPLEKLHLKLYKRADYGTGIKRFLFDTKSPDDLVKESLVKCQRLSHT